jgi:uncharacterized protein (TIGR02452 family)
MVLSAFGCGAFENPPEHISQIFSEVIKEFDGAFKNITFGIYENVSMFKSKVSNYDVFKKKFKE